jgi:hypothetical protein
LFQVDSAFFDHLSDNFEFKLFVLRFGLKTGLWVLAGTVNVDQGVETQFEDDEQTGVDYTAKGGQVADQDQL